jgi:amino acid adenylation domain-containing protein
MSEIFEGFPLSPQQERLCQVQPAWGGAPFQAEIVARVQGCLNLPRLDEALRRVAARHEILRTTFRRLPGVTLPVQVIGEPHEAAPNLSFVDVSGAAESAREPMVEESLARWRSAGIDPAEGPPLKVLLVRTGEAEYRLAVAVPALCADSMAMEILLTELTESCTAVAREEEAGLERDVLQYADLAEWLRERLDAEEGGGAGELAELAPAPLPFEEAKDQIGIGGLGRMPLTLPAGLGKALESAAAEAGVELEALLLAAWQIVLGRLTDRRTVATGVTCAGRRYEGLDTAIGLLAKALPMSVEVLSSATIGEVAAACQSALEEASSGHEYFSWSRLPRDPAGGSETLIPAAFDFHRLAEDRRLDGIEVSTLRVRTVYDRFHLRLCCAQAPGRLDLEIEYDSGRHGRPGILRLAGIFVRLLEQAASTGGARVGDLDLLPAVERHRLTRELNDTAREEERLCAHRWFERQALLSAESPALVAAGERLTYGELDARANQLARRLRTLGVGPDSVVGLFLHRSVEMVVAVLAILKAGGAYLPLDPLYPDERLAFMRDDSGMDVLVTQSGLAPRLPMDPCRVLALDEARDGIATEPSGVLPGGAGPGHLAYVIYTSGSTGRPKGVMVHHDGLANYLGWCVSAYRTGEGSGSLLHSSLGFDLTVTSLFPPLISGRTVFLAPAEDGGAALGDSLRRLSDLSLVKITPAHLGILGQALEEGEAAARTRAFVIGGEALRWEALRFWREHAPGTRLLNEYGPTETVVGCCVYEVRPEDPGEGSVPIGRPISNLRLYALDASFQPVPVGVPGELYIGGAGVARGYLGRPELTADRFVPDGLSGAPGARLYRTGDLVRYRPDGQLEFLGRTDNQVKLRGFRVELGEIEASLAAHPAVEEAVVVLRREATGAERLVAYATPRPGQRLSADALRDFLARTLPEHMLPGAFEILAVWPLTVHGKIDRNALPEPGRPPGAGRAGELAGPGSFLEEVLARIWADVLGVETVGVHDNFFQLGGDSIRSIEILARCRQQGLALSPQALFQNPTVRALTRKVALEGAPAAAFEPSQPFSGVAAPDRSALPEDAEDAYPLTRLQAGMLFHSLYSPETAVYHEMLTFHLRAPLDVETLRGVLGELIARHPVLRTSLHVAGYGEPLQIVHRQGELRLAVIDPGAGSPDEEAAAVAAWMAEERTRSFAWSEPSLIRFAVHRRDGGTFQFSLSYHHAILDGWSVATLLTELFAGYRAAVRRETAPEAATPEASFRDFVAAERRAIESPGPRRFWAGKLAGAEPLVLPRERRRDPAGRSVEIRRRDVPVPPAVLDGLARCARAEGVPVKSVLLAAHLKVLSLLCDREDVTAGLVVHARPQALAAERILGLFLNTLPLRLEVPAGAWSDLVRAAFEAELRMLPHQAFPLAEIQRTAAAEPLFDTVFNFVHFHVYQALSGLSGMEILDGSTFEETNYPLSVVCQLGEAQSRIRLRLEYDALQLASHEVERIAGVFERALAAMALDPAGRHEGTSLLAPGERHQLLVEWNDTRDGCEARSFPELVGEWARRAPDAAAVVFGDEVLTYGELGRRAERLARGLRRMGVGPDTIVGLCVERGMDLVAGFLATLEAGGAYLPLDPTYPRGRLGFMLEDSGASLLLTEPALEAGLPEHRARVERAGELAAADLGEAPGRSSAKPEDLAYVIYTSGSTGRPKGVGVTHRGLSNLVVAQHAAFGVRPPDRLLQFSSASFDASVFEIVLALGAGATLVLGRREEMIPGPALAALIDRHGVTHVTMPPSILAALEASSLPSLGTINVAGEACSSALVDRWSAGRSFYNLYGPTEATVWSSIEPCSPGTGTPPIGRPVANVSLHLLGRDRHPVPVGVPAELCIGGVSLARGYLNRPDLTAERFVPDPWSSRPGARLYRTGDLVRRLPDGRIDFLGRIDRQVKIRGFRIELGEIEAVLRRFPGVSDSVVLARGTGSGEPRLVAYLVMGGADPQAGEVRDFLRRHLPEFMVPAAFVALEAMPLTPSGKVDHAALPDPAGDRPLLREAYAPPRSAVERSIAGIWQEVLQLDRVGRDDNFFDLGGHSLLVLRMQARLREEIGADLPIVDLFTYPTVRALSEHVLRLRQGGPAAAQAPAAEASRAGAADASIAVLGMAGRFPQAPDVDELWRLLREGREAISFFSRDELWKAGVEEEALADPRYVPARAVLAGADLFDASFFGLTPREAEILDPQQRVFLESAWEALENAGYGRPAGRRIGVFAGSSMNTYWLNLLSNPEVIETVGSFQTVTSNDKDFLATRVSYKLGLTGPSLAVQTACSTSLVAVHLACQALRSGECDLALAGGVSIRLPQESGYLHLEGGIDSPDGHCRAFDAAARGTVAGNGVGVVVLKRLADALADGDPIRAVIAGSAINNDGSAKVGFTAPSVEGQAEVIRAAQRMAGIEPGEVSYVEAHGTGTPLGDPIEVAALKRAFGAAAPASCALGSLKTNLGHLDAAAGIAGLIKTVLQLEHRTLVPTLHFERPNPQLQIEGSPFVINAGLRPWERSGGPLRAGVSSFGIGGTNAHVVLEEAPSWISDDGADGCQLLVLSARSEAALDRMTANLAGHLERNPALRLGDVAYTLQAGRSELAWRRMLVAESLEEARRSLASPEPGRVLSSCHEGPAPAVAFLFPGQGSQYPGMAAGLYRDCPRFRHWLDLCAGLLQNEGLPDLPGLLEAGPDGTALHQTALAQPALFAVEYSLARLWMELGVAPQALLGHSVGELVAACLAGVFSLADGLALVAARGRLVQQLPAGAMLAAALSAEAAVAWLRDGLSLAAVNAPDSVVLSGTHGAIDRLEEELRAAGIDCRRLRTSHAFHSVMMEPALAAFAERVAQVELRRPSIPFLSNVTGTWITDAQATDPSYWATHLRSTVRFAAGVEELSREPDRLFLEVGPGQSLASLVRRHPARQPHQVVLASVRQATEPAEDLPLLVHILGRLWLAGQPVSWEALHAGERRRRVALPAYPFERRRFWIDARRDAPVRPAPTLARREMEQWFYEPSWQRLGTLSARPAGQDEKPWWILADGGPVGQALARALETSGRKVITIHPGDAPEVGLEELPGDIVHCRGLHEEEGLADGCLGLIQLAQTVLARPGAELPRLHVVTCGVFEVLESDAVRPEAALLLGPCLVLPQEHPGFRCRLVDVAPTPPPEDAAGLERWLARLVAEVTAGDPGDPGQAVTALRGGYRWRRTLEPVRRPPESALSEPSLRRGGVYLITGGLGRVGSVLAEHLAHRWNARLVLVGRSMQAVPSRIEALLATGHEVEIVAADVADREQMATALDRAVGRFGALHGVLHAAGEIGHQTFRSFQETGREDVERQLRAKVRGGLVLAELLAGRQLDVCVLISSLSSVLGGLGFTSYAAANAFLDALAHRQSQLGPTRWLSLDWDGWSFEDAAAGAAITPVEGAEVFERALGLHGVRQLAISVTDLAARLELGRAVAAQLGREPEERPDGAPKPSRPGLSTAWVAPRSDAEQRLASLWESLLGIHPVGVEDNFFELGGHSLLATQLLARVREIFRVQIPFEDLFASPTVAALACRLAELQDGGERPAVPPLVPAPREGPLPLSFSQQRLWFFQRLEPESPAYNVFAAFRLCGALDPAALASALTEIVRRHEVLRTTFTEAGGIPFQVISAEARAPLAFVDLTALPLERRDGEARERFQAIVEQPFDLEKGPLFRVLLMQRSSTDSLMLVAMHHIVCDAWSVGVFNHELAELYTAFDSGRAPSLPALPLQYADYALWQRRWLEGGALQSQLTYWQSKLAGLAPTELPTDHPRPRRQTLRGATHAFELPQSLSASLRALSQAENVTLFMLLLAGFQVLLSRYTGKSDIVLGTNATNRSSSAFEGVIGFFVNNLVLRVDVAPHLAFREHLRRVRAIALEAYAHQDVPFERLVEELQRDRDRDPGRHPLFQILFVLQNTPGRDLALPGVSVEPFEIMSRRAAFDLLFNLYEGDGGIRGAVEYNSNLFEPPTIARFCEYFETVLDQVASDPDAPVDSIALAASLAGADLADDFNASF